MRTAQSAQSQAPKVQDALEVCKEHLDFFSILARVLVGLRLRQGARDLSRRLVDTTDDFADRRAWATAGLKRATSAVGCSRSIDDRVGLGDVRSRLFEGAPLAA